MRSRIRMIIGVVLSAVLVLIVVFPPYAVMKMEGGKIARHGFAGYHPFWNPPTKQFAYEFLEKKPFVEGASPGVENSLSQYVVRFNKVRFIFNAVFLIAVAGVLRLIFRNKKSVQKETS